MTDKDLDRARRDSAIAEFVEATGLKLAEIETLTGIDNGNLSKRARGVLSTPRGERLLFRLLTALHEEGEDVRKIMRHIQDET